MAQQQDAWLAPSYSSEGKWNVVEIQADTQAAKDKEVSHAFDSPGREPSFRGKESKLPLGPTKHQDMMGCLLVSHMLSETHDCLSNLSINTSKTLG